MKRYPIATAQWLDPKSADGWQDITEALDIEPARCITTGYLISDGSEDGTVRIVATLSEDKGCGEFLCFPVGCLVDLKIIQNV